MAVENETKIYTSEEWKAEGKRRFGPDWLKWKFVCPCCGNVAAIEEFHAFRDQGATPNSALGECIGRYMGKKYGEKPCDYAGYGLIRLGPTHVRYDDTILECFAFAEVVQ